MSVPMLRSSIQRAACRTCPRAPTCPVAFTNPAIAASRRVITTSTPRENLAAVASEASIGEAGPLPIPLTPSPTPTRGQQRESGKISRPLDIAKAAQTLPPDHKAEIRELDTFALPEAVTGSASDIALGRQLVASWRKNGILQIQFPPKLQVLDAAVKQSKAYFDLPQSEKSKNVDDQSFAGYIASGEELTDGIADYSEIFTVTKDLQQNDPRVQQRWACHGPTPWPSNQYKKAIDELMEYKGQIGDKLLHLTALGLGLRDPQALNKLVRDGWHHMRVLRFPPTNATNGKGKKGRGIGSHTDYGLLVIASQDEVGGLFIRPPIQGETYANWKKSAAGAHEDAEGWVYVPPVENVFTVFPGDMMQFMTNSYLPSTPHKVGLNTRQRYAFAYFHEPNFNAVCKRLPEFRSRTGVDPADDEEIHYGTHFTNMFMRNYPERITAQRMRAENRMAGLESMKKEHGFSFDG